jgi:2-dehydropantoate 2-reductase
VYSSNGVAEPGVVLNHTWGRDMLVVGETDDRPTERIAALRARLLAEGEAIARAHGVSLEGAPRRPGGASTGGAAAHKPSMLQDYELGRPMEVDAILAVPCAFARAAGVAAPTLEAVHAVSARLAARKGLYSPP